MAYMGEKRNADKSLVGRTQKREDLKDLGVNDSVILKYMYRMASTGFILLSVEESGMLL